MSKQSISVLTLNILLGATVSEGVAVNALGVPAQTGIYGVSAMSGVAGQTIPVDVIGTTVIQASAAIPVGTPYVISDAGGLAIAGGTASACLGRLVPGQFATQAGDWIEIVLVLTI